MANNHVKTFDVPRCVVPSHGKPCNRTAIFQASQHPNQKFCSAHGGLLFNRGLALDPLTSLPLLPRIDPIAEAARIQALRDRIAADHAVLWGRSMLVWLPDEEETATDEQDISDASKLECEQGRHIRPGRKHLARRLTACPTGCVGCGRVAA